MSIGPSALDGVDGLRDRGVVGDVEDDLLGARDVRGRRGQLLRVAAVEHDRGAGLGEPAGQREPDALARSR